MKTDEPKESWGDAVKVMLFLFLLWLVIEVIAITVLGNNANNTFSSVAPTQAR